ncbi:hypothetical protein [Flavobacterium cerinum]|uniref:SMI1/KNR4 family protein n=1 Tax=Flavobacterium cerinum TaxID=2502784 RepID=A0ABY5ISI9_9FLAO|nr:hypothetical protein [Flavobacterium cerinum]UUC45760.1 hypothetical protein NOX80_00775 [Flavobacterium cerinum]
MKIYQEYFDTLKKYLLLLEIDKKKGIVGCNDQDIEKLKNEKGAIPPAYEAYLRSIGKKFLFEFMDAEDMSFESLDYINSFANEVFQENALQIEKDFFVISERRNDYISLLYSDEENPEVWIMSEYWDEKDGENLSVRTNSFTALMLIFFQQTLRNHTASFHFIPSTIKNKEAYFREKYQNWLNGLKAIKSIIDQYPNDNNLINELNKSFLDYYLANEEIITGSLNKSESVEKKEADIITDPSYSPETAKKKGLFEKLKDFFG